jgi:hypothetical protein
MGRPATRLRLAACRPARGARRAQLPAFVGGPEHAQQIEQMRGLGLAQAQGRGWQHIDAVARHRQMQGREQGPGELAVVGHPGGAAWRGLAVQRRQGQLLRGVVGKLVAAPAGGLAAEVEQGVELGQLQAADRVPSGFVQRAGVGDQEVHGDELSRSQIHGFVTTAS